MIRIAICDDSEYFCKIERDQLLKYFFDKDIEYSVDEYNTGEELINSNKNYDLIFLDYQFEDKGADGLTIAKKIRNTNSEVALIFLTSYPSVVFDTFEVDTFRFLVKPIDEKRFKKALDDFLLNYYTEKRINVRSEGKIYCIKENEIAYVEAVGRHSIIYFVDEGRKAIECNSSLGEMELKLLSRYFFRCHKSYLVGLRHIRSFGHSEIIMRDGEKIYISRSKYKTFIKAYAQFMENKRGM